jgi:hypothetical protein
MSESADHDDDGGSLKPADAYMGAIDLFAILIPGAIAVFALEPYYTTIGLFGPRGWVAFLVSAYTLGHIAYYLSGGFDEMKNVKRACDGAVDDMKKEHATEPGFIGDVYKNAKAYLAIRCPGPLTDVLRAEADSKFFRSLLVVIPFYFLVCLGIGLLGAQVNEYNKAAAVFAPVAWFLSFSLYKTLRVKAIKNALRLAHMHAATTGPSTQTSTPAEQPSVCERAPQAITPAR